MTSRARLLCAALAIVMALAGGARAREGQEEEAAARNPSHVAAREAIAARRYPEALRVLHEALARDAKDAETHNLLGFAYRKMGDLEQAFRHYHEALVLNPEHRGAHEYIGEAYLMQGNLAKAKEHLGQLDKLCFFGCEEYTDLKKAIAEFETKTKK